jgi:hypothetical protein
MKPGSSKFLLLSLLLFLPSRPSLGPLHDLNTVAAGLCERGQDWFSRDKGCHFVVSATGSSGFLTLGRQAGVRPWPAMAVAAGVMGGIGVIREIVYLRDPNLVTHRFLSRRDLGVERDGNSDRACRYGRVAPSDIRSIEKSDLTVKTQRMADFRNLGVLHVSLEKVGTAMGWGKDRQIPRRILIGEAARRRTESVSS